MAGHLIRRLNQRSTQVFSARMQQEGLELTSVQFAAMDAIRSHPELDQASIAAKIAYDRATIGGVIERLEQKGYVARVVSKRDRRAREVRLTPKGAETYARILPIVTALQLEILDSLDEEEQALFLRLASKAVRAASVAETPSSGLA